MNWVANLKAQHKFKPWQHGVIFLLACAVLISRRPDAIFHAQFLQEDGHTWFADVYNYGWWAGVLRTYEGYHHVFPRLGAALALLAPLAQAPLVLNCIAIAILVLPVNLLLSSRSLAWGSLRFRALLGAIYLVLPNTREMLNNISQSQWHLTLCAFILLVALPPKNVWSRFFDISILLLCGLTGPQCIFLFPIALYLAWKNRSRWLLGTAVVLAGTCLVQGWGLLNGGFASRPHHALGASPAMLARLVGGHVFLGTLLGGNTLAKNTSPQLFAFLLCVAVGGIIFVAFSVARSPLPMKLFLFLTSVLLAVSLVSPTAYPPPGVSMWQLLAEAGGIRYWYFPSLVFAWLLLWGFQSRAAALKTVSAVLLCVMCFGVIRDWRIAPFKDLNWAQDAKRFEAAPPGTAMTFPENPEGWDIRLVKR